tara:strand:+ start:7672 stop:8718 length:1047 start_codon:yes stop_codon:yes gene_type:complete
MTVAALLNSLAAASSMTNVISGSFSAINVALNTLTQALKDGFGAAADFAEEKFGAFKDWFNENVVTVLQPFISAATTAITAIIDIWKGNFSILFDLFTGDFDGAMQTATNLFNQYMSPLFETLSSAAGSAVDSIQSALGGAWEWVSGKFNEKVITPISNMIDNFTNAGTLITNNWDLVTQMISDKWNEKVQSRIDKLKESSIFQGLQNAWTTATGAMSAAFDATLGRALNMLSGASIQGMIDSLMKLGDKAKDLMGGALGKVVGGASKLLGGAADAVGGVLGGGGGGGGAAGTTSEVGAAGGAVNNTFNITMEVGGVTDRTDKRALATEIGNMLQEELARNTGSTTFG